MFGIPGQHVLNVFGNYPDAEASLIEECGELISVLAKRQNHMRKGFDFYRDRVIEELTHVLVSANMVCGFFNISEEDIQKEVMRKAVIDRFDTSKYEW